MDNLRFLQQSQEPELFLEIQAHRHHLHKFPELSLVEYNTRDYIATKLKEYGFEEVYSGIGGTGVVAVLHGTLDESILLRADMDALPLQEKAPSDYASEIQGVMHACGHDAHVAMLLGAARVMIRRVKEGLKLSRGIKFCFQPGEEQTNNGAAKMMADHEQHDLMDGSPRVQQCFGMHVASPFPVGQILYTTGPVTANSDRWQIKITGKAGHASSPESSIDALQIGVNVASQIYQIRGRAINQSRPCTISIGEFKGGCAPNVISDCCELTGSVRTVSDEDRDLILSKMKAIGDAHGVMHQCQVRFHHVNGNRIVVNDPTLEPFVLTALSRVGSVKVRGFDLTGEDFYSYSEKRPSAYFMIGAAVPDGIKDGEALYPHHSPLFQIDEQALLFGVRCWLSILQDWLAQ